MIDTVTQAVIDLLKENGINAMRRYPYSGYSKKDVIACVCIKSSKRSGSGMGDYLGLSTDPVTMETVELYGFKLKLAFDIDIFAPYGEGFGPSACISCFDSIDAALRKAPSGLSINLLACGDVKPHKDSEMLCCTAKLECDAFLLSLANEETAEFSTFTLKGVLK